MNIFFISLGCDKNLSDSEMMMGLLHDHGYEFTDDENLADVIVVNTCGFISDAKEESINTILSMAEYKKDRCKALIVTGCLSQRYQDEIQKELPEIDAIVGTTAFDRIVEVIDETLKGHAINALDSIDRLCRPEVKRVITTGGYYSYLKIAEGCNKRCTYCSIPNIRGAYRSIPMDQLIEEAQYLANNGIKELILVAQETTVYGQDLYGHKSLSELLRKLCRIKGIEWIRLLYCYPEEIDDELILTIREEKKICHYLDMPIQHASDDILRRMGRWTTRKELEAIIAGLRREIPDICLRTTLITGFPGETQAEHEELLDFIDEMEFDRLGVFAYSPEEDTPAASFQDQVDEETKLSRLDELMALQQEVSIDKSERMIGRELEVIIEGIATDAGEEVYVARSYMDAPNVDGYVFIHTEENLMSGDFAKVKVTGALEYDLIGELIE